MEPLIESVWILATPIWARVKAHLFVVVTLDLRMTKVGEPRLE